MLSRNLNWYMSTILITPLIYLIYYISKLNIEDDKALGLIGVLILFCFNQFFFQRRNLIYTTKTVIWFYIFGILSSLFISYTYFYTKSDLIGFLVLFQIYFFFVILSKTSISTKEVEVDTLKIEDEEESQKWYQKILATKTQQKKNKEFIIDFFIFAIFIIAILLIKDLFI